MRTQGRPVLAWHAPTSQQISTSHSPNLSTGCKKRSFCGSADERACHKKAAFALPPRQGVWLSPLLINTAVDALVSRFNTLLSCGQVDGAKTRGLLRCWAQRSLRLGKDSSYGALDRISKMMGLSNCMHVIEDPTSLSTEPDGTLMGGMEALHPALKGLEDGSAMVACYVLELGRVGLFANADFQRNLMDHNEAMRELDTKHCLPIYLWASMFTPESQAELFDSVGGLLFNVGNDVTEISNVLMCVGRDGSRFRGLVRVRHAVEFDGCRSSCVLSIIPLPCPGSSPPHAVHLPQTPPLKPELYPQCLPASGSWGMSSEAGGARPHAQASPLAFIPAAMCSPSLIASVGPPPPLLSTQKAMAQPHCTATNAQPFMGLVGPQQQFVLAAGDSFTTTAAATPALPRTPSVADLCEFFHQITPASSGASSPSMTCQMDDPMVCQIDDSESELLELLDLQAWNW